MPWKESREARPLRRSDMVTSQGSMPPLYTAAAISLSPLLPSSLITATLTLPDACITNDHVTSVVCFARPRCLSVLSDPGADLSQQILSEGRYNALYCTCHRCTWGCPAVNHDNLQSWQVSLEHDKMRACTQRSRPLPTDPSECGKNMRTIRLKSHCHCTCTMMHSWTHSLCGLSI